MGEVDGSYILQRGLRRMVAVIYSPLPLSYRAGSILPIAAKAGKLRAKCSTRGIRAPLGHRSIYASKKEVKRVRLLDDLSICYGTVLKGLGYEKYATRASSAQVMFLTILDA